MNAGVDKVGSASETANRRWEGGVGWGDPPRVRDVKKISQKHYLHSLLSFVRSGNKVLFNGVFNEGRWVGEEEVRAGEGVEFF